MFFCGGSNNNNNNDNNKWGGTTSQTDHVIGYIHCRPILSSLELSTSPHEYIIYKIQYMDGHKASSRYIAYKSNKSKNYDTNIPKSTIKQA